ncbi:PAS domain-containing protein [bacterium]|nr:PAS domain-containing protein [bacterium]
MSTTEDLSRPAHVPVIGVGASAGGLEALREMFSGHEASTGMAFVVVQHLDPTHDSLMAQLIERYTIMTVAQAAGGEKLEADHVYVIPPGHGLAIEGDTLELTEFSDPRGMRRPIDDFFESLAQNLKADCACVILSGTGGDGSRGLRAVMDAGGLCVVQKPDSARYDGMPTSAIATGYADIVAEPENIIEHLRRFFDRTIAGEDVSEPLEDLSDYVEDLCALLKEAVGHDFSSYKRPTLVRRIGRRMQILGVDETAEYIRHLADNPDECEALFRDLLINVTQFFRDIEQFEKVERDIIDPLVAGIEDSEEIRIWVAGCSSGEEAFTFAIIFAEAMRKHDKRPYVQIFATDIDDKMLSIGRAGTYPSASLSDIPVQYRDRYTIADHGSFTMAPQLRDMVRFSRHSLIKDPPFSKLDVVSCRNLLIYFDEDLQNRVLPLFHFSLRENGHLFLGTSEAIGRFDDLFEVIDQPARLFKRRNVESRYSLQLTDRSSGQRRRIIAVERELEHMPRVNPIEMSALSRIAEQFAPVSLLVDHEGNLIQRWGRAGRFLEFPDRTDRSAHVPTLAKPGLREVVGALLREVRETARRTIVREIEVITEFGKLPCAVIGEPVDDFAILLVIRETGALQAFEGDDLADLDQKEGQLKFLEEELQVARHRLRSTVEELETTNEELKSSNEEMMSMNEELQSTNEELTTVNDELKTKVDQLVVANSDLKNFFDSTELVVIVVDQNMNVRSLTDAAQELFTIEKNVRGTALAQLETSLSTKDYIGLVSAAAKDGAQGEYRAITADRERQFIARAIPYRRMDGTVDGATLIFTDVTTALSLERDLSEERERLGLALEVAGIGVWEYEPTTDMTILDDVERRLLDIDTDDEEASMSPILSKMSAEDRDRINLALRQAMDGQKDFDEVFKFPIRSGGERWLHGLGRRVEAGGTRKFIGVTYDVTAERQSLEQREMMIKEMNHRVKNLFAVISSMISASVQETEDVGEFATLIRSRIGALDRSHSLSTDRDVDDVLTLKDLINTVLSETPKRTTISLEGPDVYIARDQLTPLGLIFHEWATNSSKYGALAHESGKLSVTWKDEDGDVSVVWIETGSLSDDEVGTGFGTRLISASAMQLSGSVEGHKIDNGFERKLKFPVLADTAT